MLRAFAIWDNVVEQCSSSVLTSTPVRICSEKKQHKYESYNLYKTMSKHTPTSKNSLPETLSVWLTAAVFPVNVFSAWQLMDSSETWRFTVMSTPLPVTVFPYKVHVKLQEGVHSAEHVKLAVTPISRASGPLIITFLGPSARREPQIQALADVQKSQSVFLSGIISSFDR